MYASEVAWEYRAGVILAVRYLRRNPVPIVDCSMVLLPHLSRRMVRLALWLFPRFLERADLTFPIIVAGRGWFQIALDGRHRLSKALMQGVRSLPTVRVPWPYALELLIPGVFEVEWLGLLVERSLRRRLRRWREPGHRRWEATSPDVATGMIRELALPSRRGL